MKRTVAVLLLFISFVTGTETAFSQQRSDGRPAWVLHQIAERHYRAREFAQALEMYGEALVVHPVYPEAMVGMARVHRAAGDTTLAERYYRQALADSHHLVIPDEEFAIRLELAELYSLSGPERDERLRREQLQTVVDRDPIFSRREEPNRRDAMEDLLYRSGLDRVLVLYRLEFPQALEAHHRLGVLLSDSNDPEDRRLAVEHFLFAAVEIAGRAVRALIEIQFDFEFTTIENLLATADAYPEVAAYLESAGFRRILLALADALDAAPDERGSARAEAIRSAL